VADVVRDGAGLVYHRICDDKWARTFTSLLGDYHGWVVADALGRIRRVRGAATA
jgi:hypothetical protein